MEKTENKMSINYFIDHYGVENILNRINNIDIVNHLDDWMLKIVNDEEVEISESTVAADVEGWDSLAQVLIVGQLQNEIGVRLSSTEVAACANVGEFVDAIIKKM